MYTSIKNSMVTMIFCPFNIISRVNNYMRERERDSFFNYPVITKKRISLSLSNVSDIKH